MLTVVEPALVTVSVPATPAIDPADPSLLASLRFASDIAEVPVAVLARVAETVATTPLAIGVVFNPARRQVRPLQDNVFPAAEATGPS
jgi:hypothetical protein